MGARRIAFVALAMILTILSYVSSQEIMQRKSFIHPKGYKNTEEIPKELWHKLIKRIKTEGEKYRRLVVSLSEQAYLVTQKKHTDPPNVGYTKTFEKGTYHWVVCDKHLFNHYDKYVYNETTSSLPEFNFEVDFAMTYDKGFFDTSRMENITEIHCKDCNAYIGALKQHCPVYSDSFTWEVNSSALHFKKEKQLSQEELDKIDADDERDFMEVIKSFPRDEDMDKPEWNDDVKPGELGKYAWDDGTPPIEG